MAMFREVFVWFILLIFNLVSTILLITQNKQLFNVSIWVTWLLWGIITLIIIGLLIFRKYLQKKYASLNNNLEQPMQLNKNEYFFQTPLYTIDNQTIYIYGEEDMSYTVAFFNNLHKIISMFGFQPIYSIYLTTNRINVKVIPNKILTLRPKYNVYMNEKHVGTFGMKKFFSKGGKQQLPYTFNYDSKDFSLNNPFFSTETTISDPDNNILLSADRSLLDFSKNKQTNKRGEKHKINIISNQINKEILIAIYIQAIINKQTQPK